MIVVLPRLKETRFQLEKTPEVMEEDVLIKKKKQENIPCVYLLLHNLSSPSSCSSVI